MSTVKVMLAGDVMTGRGIDQILPNPSEPALYEAFVRSAVDYVQLAEEANGPIPRNVPFDYIWGDALPVLGREAPDLRIVNLETAVTTSDRPAPKGINYRMNPRNVGCIAAAGIDCCILANNHVLDWGQDGLIQTLSVLQAAGIRVAGAGADSEAAAAPASLPLKQGTRVLVYAFACPSSGVPADWAARADRPGVAFLDESTDAAVGEIAARIGPDRAPRDLVVCSLHWGPNWGYEVSARHRAFAHALIERAGVDIVYGHSSHHPKAIEVHGGKPILYGCGDLLNDYEGIGNHEPYRDDLSLMYFASMDSETRRLAEMRMVPFRIRRFRLNRASASETGWLRATMDRECRRFGRGVSVAPDGALMLSNAA
jgi:poly-gamma-glutamate capsule biosynthesis protein CapA/YwtB (metallophosphatase superfamily)